MSRPVQHSFSALTLYETCPKKYWHTKIRRDVKDSMSAVGNYGHEAHKAFENRLLKDKPLPMDLQHHEPVLSRLAAAPGEGLPEQKLAINKRFQPTGFFDDDVWLRAVIDYVKIAASSAVIVDHKFGKMKDDFTQVELCAAVFSCFRPSIETYSVAYYWAMKKKFTRKKLTKDHIPAIWEKLMPRFDRLDMAAKQDEFPAKQNGLCRKHCPVLSCPHNGRS